MTKRGVKAYLGRSKLEEIFERHVRPQVEKKYEIHDESDELKAVAGFKVGLRKTDLAIDVKVWKYAIGFDRERNEVTFTVLDQQISGNLLLHVERAAKLIINFGGDFINKDYQVNLLLLIKVMVLRGRVKQTTEGFPEIEIGIDLPGFDLQHDLEYHVENSDLLTDTLNLVKGLWMSELEAEIKKSLLPVLDEHITQVVNAGIRSVYKTEYHYFGDKNDVNLSMNLECEGFEVSNDFAILTLNGFVDHIQHRRKMYSVLPQGYMLPDISRITGEDFAVVEVSDDVIHSAIMAYFLNDLNFEQEFTEAGCKSMNIEHSSREKVHLVLGRSDNIYGSEIFVRLTTRFRLTVKHKFFPALSFGLHVRLLVDDIRVYEKPADSEHFFVAIRISEIEIIEMLNFEMGPMSDTMKKSKIVSTIQEKSAQTIVTKEIEIAKIRIGANSVFEAVNYTVYDDFIALVGKLAV